MTPDLMVDWKGTFGLLAEIISMAEVERVAGSATALPAYAGGMLLKDGAGRPAACSSQPMSLRWWPGVSGTLSAAGLEYGPTNVSTEIINAGSTPLTTPVREYALDRDEAESFDFALARLAMAARPQKPKMDPMDF